MKNKRFISVIALVMVALALAGCASPSQNPVVASAPISALATPAPAETPASSPAATQPVPNPTGTIPRYVFLFIGDGMSFAQINAAQYYSGSDKSGDISINRINFTQFPVAGVVNTYNLTSVIPDSASTGTAMATGVRTETGMLGQTADGQSIPNIAEILHAAGKKIGIISSVTLNNATPAAFYAHAKTRTDYADVAGQMANSGFEYFGGGGLYSSSEKDSISKDYGLFEKQGYTIADTKAEIEALSSSSGKVYAVSPNLAKLGALPFAIDAKEDDMTLADFVNKGIDVLDNDNGFFMMCEGGKIDWSCHANDAATTVKEVLAFADAVQKAIDFANEHPDDTLILVTADHETGGMAVGYSAMAYSTNLDMLGSQKVSYSLFKALITDMISKNPDLSLDEVMPVIGQYFGLYSKSNADKAESSDFVLSDYEYGLMKDAFAESKKVGGSGADDEWTDLLYGSYDPLTVTLTHILDNKAGVGWTTYAHTGLTVPVYASGTGASLFSGSYDDTEIFNKLIQVLGLQDQITQ
jgi:alkaline phosphatase